MEIAMDGVEKLVIQDKTYYLVGTNQKRYQKYTSPE